MPSLLIPQNSPVAMIAAKTFADIWRRICGEDLKFLYEDDGGDLVVFGSDATLRFVHEKIMEGAIKDFDIRIATDDYHICSCNDGARNLLFLAHGRPRALIYAVYRFFELCADCRYFWDGDIIPEGDAPNICGIDIAESPRFEYRGLRYFAHRGLHRFQAEHWSFDDWKREIDWVLKRRMNLFMLRIGIDDLFHRAFPDIVDMPDGYETPEAIKRSFNDRTLFWSMRQRSELRRKVLEYARVRDIMHPEDVGTISHWYSRTPMQFLEKVKPTFLPQANSSYNEPTGLAWDIREDENLDNYFKLTETHIREYGSPEIFHTIGLAERYCFKDHMRNQEMKRYTYRRIISKLREKYCNAPLLVGTWDFFSTWSAEEVKTFVRELDPSNTIILDYTSDVWVDDNNFQNWDIIGKIPWIYGIFHAYEASNEIRGNYANIRNRFPKAIADPMCKGVVFWPENSHQDTLMLDYFSEMAWDPSRYRIEDFLPHFCKRRYGTERAGEMLELWRRFLPIAEASRWGTVSGGHSKAGQREIYPDSYFTLRGFMYGQLDALRVEYFCFETRLLLPLMENAVDTLKTIGRADFTAIDEFTRRDFIDILRTVAARSLELQFALTGLLIDAWTRRTIVSPFSGLRQTTEVSGRDLLAAVDKLRRLGVLFSDILEASPEFSLNHSLARLHAEYETNPDFEATLKGNVENYYCRSHIYELARFVYEREFEIFAQFVQHRVADDNREAWMTLSDEIDAMIVPARDEFYDKPLADMAPSVETAIRRLPDVIANLAAETGAYREIGVAH